MTKEGKLNTQSMEEWEEEFNKLSCLACEGEGKRYQSCEECGDCLQRCSECDGTGFEWDEGIFEKIKSLLSLSNEQLKEGIREEINSFIHNAECVFCDGHPPCEYEMGESDLKKKILSLPSLKKK